MNTGCVSSLLDMLLQVTQFLMEDSGNLNADMPATRRGQSPESMSSPSILSSTTAHGHCAAVLQCSEWHSHKPRSASVSSSSAAIPLSSPAAAMFSPPAPAAASLTPQLSLSRSPRPPPAHPDAMHSGSEYDSDMEDWEGAGDIYDQYRYSRYSVASRMSRFSRGSMHTIGSGSNAPLLPSEMAKMGSWRASARAPKAPIPSRLQESTTSTNITQDNVEDEPCDAALLDTGDAVVKGMSKMEKNRPRSLSRLTTGVADRNNLHRSSRHFTHRRRRQAPSLLPDKRLESSVSTPPPSSSMSHLLPGSRHYDPPAPRDPREMSVTRDQLRSGTCRCYTLN